MATPSVSAPGQGVGNTGYCVLSWADPLGLDNVSISFLPTLCKIVNHQYAPLQKTNISINGTIHVLQYGPQELLQWVLEMQDLPYDIQASRRIGHPTDGFVDLLSFVRTTVNYTAKPFTCMTPDGQIEQVRYMKGLETFREAAGATNRAQFWTGTLTVMRIIL